MSQRVKSTTVPWSSFVEGDDGCIGLNDKLLCFWQTTQEIMQHMQGNTPYLFLIPSTTFLTFQISPEDFCSNLRKFSVADWQETNRSFSDISKKSHTHLRVKRTHPSPLYSWDKRQKTLNMCTYVRYKVVAAYVCVYVCRNQCDQIALFLKDLGNQFSFKGSPNIGWLLWPFWKMALLSTHYSRYLLGNFCKSFYFHISSTSVRKPVWPEYAIIKSSGI